MRTYLLGFLGLAGSGGRLLLGRGLLGIGRNLVRVAHLNQRSALNAALESLLHKMLLDGLLVVTRGTEEGYVLGETMKVVERLKARWLSRNRASHNRRTILPRFCSKTILSEEKCCHAPKTR